MKKRTLERQAFLAGEKLDYRIEFRKRSSLSVTVYPDRTVILRVPKHFSLRGAEEFFSSKFHWIEERLKSHPRLPSLAKRSLPLLGHTYPLSDLASPTKVRLANSMNSINSVNSVHLPEIRPLVIPKLVDDEDDSLLRKRLAAWYTKQAHSILPVIFAETFTKFAPHHPKTELKLRKMKSRWGSCSNKKKITLNSELVKLPYDCIEYIIIHEIAHLKVLNHSRAFYQHMESMLPDWKDKEKKLKEFARSQIFLGSLV
jgi:predicted metal-dependent hydrolase